MADEQHQDLPGEVAELRDRLDSLTVAPDYRAMIIVTGLAETPTRQSTDGLFICCEWKLNEGYEFQMNAVCKDDPEDREQWRFMSASIYHVDGFAANTMQRVRRTVWQW
ncbi:MAG: hypothetical protein AAF456_11895 [Planctomycetota bacterium]